MTSVAPPPPPPQIPASALPAPQLSVTISSPPLALSQLALDSLINGLIRPATPQGEMVLQTNLGTLQFKSPFSLPQGAQATFKLVQSEPTVQLQLTHINGKPIPANTPQARVPVLASQFMQNMTGKVASSPTTPNNIGNTTGPATQINLNTAPGLRAFVLSTNPAQNSAQTLGALGQQNSSQGKVPSASTSLPFALKTQLASTPAKTSSQNVTGQVVSPNSSGAFQAGNQLSVRLLSVQQLGQNQTTTLASSSSSSKTVVIQGTVQGMTGAGQPIIRTPQGLIALDTTTKIPEGALLRLEILSSSKPTSGTSGLQAASSPSQSLSKSWPALEEALNLTRTINPAVTEHLTNTLIPRPDSRMAANIISFLKALGRGNITNWTGEQTLRAIAKSKPDLLSKLENDFSTLSAKSQQPTSTEWKIAYVPMQGDEKIQQMCIALRDQEEEKEGEKEEGGLRFVIDVDLSKMGPMQFDGLAKEQAKKFDLIIRTHSTLEGHVRKNIHEIFENSMEVVGFEGNILFQVTAHFVNVEGMEVQSGTLNLGMLV